MDYINLNTTLVKVNPEKVTEKNKALSLFKYNSC